MPLFNAPFFFHFRHSPFLFSLEMDQSDSEASDGSNHVEDTEPVQNYKIDVQAKAGTFVVAHETDSRNKAVKRLLPGWSERLVEIIWENRQLPCAWTFVRGRARTYDIIVVGKCKDCGAGVEANYAFETNNLHIEITKVQRNVLHRSKRFMSKHGDSSGRVSALLSGMSAYAVHKKLCDEIMSEDAEFVPAHVPGVAALRQRKCRLQEVSDKDPILALKNMKFGEFREDIQNIGLDPFYVFYMTKLQSQWYNSTFKGKKAVVSIDATGLGLKKLQTSQSSAMLLYTICATGIWH